MILLIALTLYKVNSLPTIRPKFLPQMRAEDSVEQPEPTTPTGCLHEGVFYPANTFIRRTYDAAADWCYGLFCNSNGLVVPWDGSTCT